MCKKLLFSAVACLALASAALGPPANADAGGQPASAKARGLDPDTRVKLPPESLGPDQLDPDANELAGPQTGPAPQAVAGGGCILPFTALRYRLFTGAPQIYTFRAAPTRGFDVVMRIDMPGVHKTVDLRFAGGTETYRVQTFFRNLPVTVVISGYRGSFGCFNFAVTP